MRTVSRLLLVREKASGLEPDTVHSYKNAGDGTAILHMIN